MSVHVKIPDRFLIKPNRKLFLEEMKNRTEFENEIRNLDYNSQLEILNIIVEDKIPRHENEHGTYVAMNLKEHRKTLYKLYTYIINGPRIHKMAITQNNENRKLQIEQFRKLGEDKKNEEKVPIAQEEEVELEGAKITLKKTSEKFTGVKSKLLKNTRKRKKFLKPEDEETTIDESEVIG